MIKIGKTKKIKKKQIKKHVLLIAQKQMSIFYFGINFYIFSYKTM